MSRKQEAIDRLLQLLVQNGVITEEERKEIYEKAGVGTVKRDQPGIN